MKRLSQIIVFASRSIALFLCALLLSIPLLGQNQQDLEIVFRSTNRTVLSEMGFSLSRQMKASKDLGYKIAGESGWVIRKDFDDGKIIELKGINRHGKPVYYSTANINAAKTVSTNKVWSGGSLGLNLTGTGIIMREWDGGVVRPTHQELTGRTTMGDGATSLSDHSTHVAGTMMATGISANAHGMANLCTLRAFDWWDDYAEMTTEAANGALLSNHSYIYITGWYYSSSSWYWYGDPAISPTTDYLYGFYMEDAATVDQIAFNAPYYLVCKAAGNDRLGGPSVQPVQHYVWQGSNWVLSSAIRDLNGGPNGWDCISSGFGVSKNVMTVGAVNPIPNGYSVPADVVFASFSGTGPTDDGRIKPDIVADGIGLYSTLSGSNNAYGSMSGTSMATPNTAGSLMLLQEHYHNIHGTYMRSATLKGLAIHTADEAGSFPGPDYKFGWGLLNTAKAANAITQVCTSVIREETLTSGTTFTVTLNAKGTEPLIATLCWTDPPGTPPPPSLNPPTLMLVNDLDMRIDGNTYKPYILDPLNVTASATAGDNFRDNVEKIFIQSPSPGSHTLTITHKGILLNGSQPFSLVVTGLNTSLNAGSIGSDQTICHNSAPLLLTGLAPGGGLPPYTYQWQISTDNTVFNNIPNATGLNYQPGNLTSTTYYREIQTSSGSCGNVITNTVTITVTAAPLPTITGPSQLCPNSGYATYSTEQGMSNYLWSCTSGGNIISGQGTSQVMISWGAAGPQSVGVTYTDASGCNPISPTLFPVTVDPPPGAAGTVSGKTAVCQNEGEITYTVDPIPNTVVYIWTLPPGAVITAGNQTNAIMVDYSSTAASGEITVYGNNLCGNGTSSPPLPVTVNPIPPVPVIMQAGDSLVSDAPQGNQWFNASGMIPGANLPVYHPTENGLYQDVVTLSGCESAPSPWINFILTGTAGHASIGTIRIYPNPATDQIFIELPPTFDPEVRITLSDIPGANILSMETKPRPIGITRVKLDVHHFPPGLYFLKIESGTMTTIRKVLLKQP